MGGNAVKNVRRYSKDEYFDIVSELSSLLESKGVKFNVIEAYKNKDSFGDMDILISKGNGQVRDLLLPQLLDELKPTDITYNSNVVSIAYKEFQIDLIFIKDKWFDFAKNYFKFNDLGNLVGRVTHKFGFKFGFDGVSYVFRDGDYVIDEILLSNDFHEMLELFGFDSKKYQQGFDDLEDIFKFVIDSKYFNPSIYLLDNRNHIARQRDRKRKTYTAFLEYTKDIQGGYVFLPKQHYLEMILQQYPDFKKAYDEANIKNEERKIIKSKFNGLKVSELTGLTDKELGMFIAKYKSSLVNYQSFILDNSQETIDNSILTFFNSLGENT